MIRRTLGIVSAAAVFALSAAAPAVACDHPASTTSSQAQQEHAKFADRGFLRHHNNGHHRRFEQQSQGTSQSSDSQQGSAQQSSDDQQQSQQQGSCDHDGQGES